MDRVRGDLPGVTFYYRKPRTVGNYSVEFIFHDVAGRLKSQIHVRNVVSRFVSSGFFKRLYNCVEAIFRQGDINHITGDVHFIGIFLKKRKTIQTILDCGQLAQTTGIKHRIFKYFWFSIPIRRCSFVTAISSATKNEILRFVACDPDKIIVVPVAISESFKKTEHEFNKANPRILQIGTAPNKNIDRLIEALHQIPCTLVIIGKRNDHYEMKMNEMGIRYEYLSGLSNEEIKTQYQRADILSLVSIYEGFGMPILEAQATGRVVITANVTSMPEVAGNAACIVDPYQPNNIREGILKIIHDDEYRNGLIEKGYENILRYDPNKIAAEYMNVYQKILAKV
jgi:glycosyltransferase involved in cell wall biosynthesis